MTDISDQKDSMNQADLKRRSYMSCFDKELSTLDSSIRIRETASNQASQGATLAHYYGPGQPVQLELPLLLKALDQQHGERAILLIENIDLEAIVTLGIALDIPARFFANHLQNPAGSSMWHSIFGSSDFRNSNLLRHKHLKNSASAGPTGQTGQTGSHDHRRTKECWHVDGVLQIAVSGGTNARREDLMVRNNVMRNVEVNRSYGYQGNTRISCILKGSYYVILVDVLPTIASDGQPLSPSDSKLHFPVSKSRGGLCMPQLFDRPQFVFSECLERFFSHPWHFDVLFGRSTKILAPETFLYLVSASTWASNHRYLKSRIKRIAFEDIRRPSIKITDSLHDCRESLENLRSEVSHTKSWIPAVVHEEMTEVRALLGEEGYVDLPGDRLQIISDEAETTEKFLMDTYQLLMSSISVLDSQTSIDQARRAQTLTQLALVYVPFSFVTGIFGMNVKELNGSSLSVWVCVPVLAATLITTMVVFKIHASYTDIAKGGRWHRGRTARSTKRVPSA